MRHLEELIESVHSGEYDVATGSRLHPESMVSRPKKRAIPSHTFNGLVRLMLRSPLYDHQCGFKAFDRETLFSLIDSVEDDHWFWDTELLVRANRAGYRVREFPVEWTPKGDTKVDLVRDVAGMGGSIVRLWWQLSIQPKITRRVTLAAGTLLTLFAVVLMTQYLNFGVVLSHIQNANLTFVLVAALIYTLSWPIRGTRYRDILNKLGYFEGTWFLTGAVFLSQTGNLVFPARAGDAVRAYIVKTRRAVPYSTGFASLAVERVFDLLTITVLAGTVLLGIAITGIASIESLSATIAGGSKSGQIALLVAGIVGGLAFILVTAIIASARTEHNFIRSGMRRLSTDIYADRVADIIESFVGDIQTIAGDRRAFMSVGAASLVIWTLDVATALMVFAAFDLSLSLPTLVAVGFFAVSVGNLAKVLPLSPGGLGLYEGAFSLLVIGLTPVGLSLALAAAIVDHAVKNLITVIGGAISMLVLNVSLTTAAEEGRDAAEAFSD